MEKWVLVTGASRGIGREAAIELSKSGFNIVLHCRKNLELLKALQSEIKTKTRVLAFDIANRKETISKITSDIEAFGPYFGVVLNAGINKDNIFPLLEDNEWDDVINTNLTGFYNVLKPVITPLITNKIKGRIVCVSSVSGLRGNRGQTNYSASKAGIIGASKALSLELAKRGITVNCVAPGVIETDMTKDVPKEVEKLIPMKRFGKAGEVAGLINYLFSDSAGYITGQVISVDGGLN